MRIQTDNVTAAELLQCALQHTTPTGRYDRGYTRPVKRSGDMARGETLDATGETYTNLSSAADILTPEELAQRLKVDVEWIYEKRRPRCPNPIPAMPLGKGTLRFDWTEIIKWLEACAKADSERRQVPNGQMTGTAKRTTRK